MKTDIWLPDVTSEEGRQDYMDGLMRKTDEANIRILNEMWEFYRSRSIKTLDLTIVISDVIDSIESRTAAPAPAPPREEKPHVEEPEEFDDSQANYEFQEMLQAVASPRFPEDPLQKKIKMDLRGIGEKETISDKIRMDFDDVNRSDSLADAIAHDLRSFTNER